MLPRSILTPPKIKIRPVKCLVVQSSDILSFLSINKRHEALEVSITWSCGRVEGVSLLFWQSATQILFSLCFNSKPEIWSHLWACFWSPGTKTPFSLWRLWISVLLTSGSVLFFTRGSSASLFIHVFPHKRRLFPSFPRVMFFYCSVVTDAVFLFQTSSLW